MSALGVHTPLFCLKRFSSLELFVHYIPGPSWYKKSVTMAVSSQNVTMQDNEPKDWSLYIIEKNQTSKSFLHETSVSKEQTFGHGEMVKHTVYKNCCSTSLSGHIRYPITWSVVCPFAHYLISFWHTWHKCTIVKVEIMLFEIYLIVSLVFVSFWHVSLPLRA